MDFLVKVKNLLYGKGSFNIEEAIREKRFSPRMKCEVQALCTLEDGEDISCIVSEIGLFGLRFNIGRELKQGEVVKVTAIKGIGILQGAKYTANTVTLNVIWCKRRKNSKDFMVGLQFSETRKNLRESWAAYLLKKFGVAVGVTAQKRKKVRIPTSLPLSYRTQDGQEMKGATVIDIGLGGMLVASESNFPDRQELRFRIGPYKFLAPLFCDGRVVHHSFVHARGKWIAGVVFTRFDEAQTKLLNSYLVSLLTDKAD
ncbi:MAG: PilZ domain-containing protein [Candidatus Xenobiia bacterium LiM19]